MPQIAKRRTIAIFISLIAGIWAASTGIAAAEPGVATEPMPATVGPEIRTEWFTVELFNQKAGWSKNIETVYNGEVESESQMEFSLGRGATVIKVRMATLFTETAGGKPIRMRIQQEMAAAPMTQEFAFSGDGVEVTTITEAADGKEVRSTVKKPLPAGEWLTPAKLSRITKEKIKSGEKKFSLVSLDPSSGLDVVTIERELKGLQTLKVGGKSIETAKWATLTKTSSGVNMAGMEYLDGDLDVVKSENNFGGIAMNTTRSDASVAAGKFVAPEMFMNMFIKPDRAIESPRQLKTATYLLSVKEGQISNLPTTAAQTFEKLDARSGRLTVNTKKPAEAAEAEIKDRAYLGNSAMISMDDPLIKSLRMKALKGKEELSPRERAEILRRFVYKYITNKEMSKGFAGAAEVAKTCSGDCSEHGVLLAALLRADGIPSRVVCGAIYVDEFAGSKGVFGYHMWTQALVDIDAKQRWVDFDATLPGDAQSFDAAHIAIGVSALEDGELNNAMMNLVPLLGRLEIKVEKTK